MAYNKYMKTKTKPAEKKSGRGGKKKEAVRKKATKKP